MNVASFAILGFVALGCGGAEGGGDVPADSGTSGDATDGATGDTHPIADSSTDVLADTTKSDAASDVGADAALPCPTTPWTTSYTLVPTVAPPRIDRRPRIPIST